MDSDGAAFVAGLRTCFAELHDPRVQERCDHTLLDIVAITLLASMCGADDWPEVEVFGRKREPWLRTFLELPNGIPSHDTFGRVFGLVERQQFAAGLFLWTQALHEATGGTVIAIDGKTARRSLCKKSGLGALHLVTAWATESGLTLGQVACAEKSNEITAIPELLALLDITSCTVTIDAMGCQKEIAAQIIEQKGDYPRAVREGFLVDYDTVKLKSDVRMQGVFLKEGEAVDYIDPESGAEHRDKLEDERQFASAEVEKTVTSPDSNRKILTEIKGYAEAHEAKYGRFPKTLIFAANDAGHTSHANEVVDLARKVFGRGESFVQKITGRSDRPLQRIREFRNRPAPSVVVSVDLMSTDVDIPDLEFLVFLRPVKSRILFEQMIGRGTRKGEKYPDKSHFVVFDCFDGTLLDYFKNCTGVTSEPPETPGRSIEQVISDIWANRDRAYNVRCLVRRLQRIEKEVTGDGRADFAAFGIPNGDIGAFAGSLTSLLANNFTTEMQRLRNPDFQRLLVDYQRRPKVFIKARENEDTVSSEYRFRDAAGQEYTAAGFLTRFAQWVTEKQYTLEPLRVLLHEPKKWNAATLKELTHALTATTERFTAERLELAHRLHDGKAKVDLVSAVKRAANPTTPLLTAEERAARAVELATVAIKPTADQAAWLDRIRRHLGECFSAEKDDFDTMPVFADFGGWGRANKVFSGSLTVLLDSLNEALTS